MRFTPYPLERKRCKLTLAPTPECASFKLLCAQVAESPPRHLTSSKPVWIFGAGSFGRDVCLVLSAQGFDVRGFIETTPRKNEVLGRPVLSWSDTRQDHRAAQLVIGIFNRGMPLDELEGLANTAGFADLFMPWDIYGQIGAHLGWRFWLSAPNVILDNLPAIERAYLQLSDETSRQCLLDICAFRLGQRRSYASFRHAEPQYFNDLTLGPLAGAKVCFVDGGAYNGDTFLELTNNADVAAAYLFEPDIANFNALANAVKSSGCSAVCLPLALSNKHCVLSFNAGNGESGAVSDQGNTHVTGVALDELLPNQQVDFFKLDVEGGEFAALQGARRTLVKTRPVLAISLYHRPHDLWELTELLSNLCQNYSFHIRQHYFNSFESVLYAIPNERVKLANA